MSNHVGFLVDKVALGQVLSEYFGSPCQFSFHLLLQSHHILSGAGRIGQLVAGAPSGLSLTPPPKKNLKLQQIVVVFVDVNHTVHYSA
jgi:hypothetical protein